MVSIRASDWSVVSKMASDWSFITNLLQSGDSEAARHCRLDTLTAGGAAHVLVAAAAPAIVRSLLTHVLVTCASGAATGFAHLHHHHHHLYFVL